MNSSYNQLPHLIGLKSITKPDVLVDDGQFAGKYMLSGSVGQAPIFSGVLTKGE